MTVRMLVSLVLGFFIVITANAASFTIKSPAFSDNDRLPVTYTCNGKSKPPALTWANPPEKTQSFVLIVYCPDAGIGGPFYNWVLYNIPANATGLDLDNENLPRGTLVGLNGYGELGYASPCPPDARTHHYVFLLYALDTLLDLPEEADIEQVHSAIRYHILNEAQLTGIYSH